MLIGSDIHQISQTIQSGGLVVFPTETVYGLGADATNPEAIKKIYSLKERPEANPIIVHIANRNQLNEIAKSISVVEEKLIQHFWPGPLTIIFPKKESFPDAVCGGGDSIGARLPSDSFLQQLIRAANRPIAAPSANRSGKPSPTRFEDLDPEITQHVDWVVPGDDCQHGLESTVVRVEDDHVWVLRPGAITKEDLEAVLGDNVKVGYQETAKEDVVPSPGTRYRHYAPQTKLQLVNKEELGKLAESLVTKKEKVALLVSNETYEKLKKGMDSNLFSEVSFLKLGSEKDLKQIAADLFHNLHQVDTLSADLALVQTFPIKGIGVSIMDRLTRAANAN